MDLNGLLALLGGAGAMGSHPKMGMEHKMGMMGMMPGAMSNQDMKMMGGAMPSMNMDKEGLAALLPLLLALKQKQAQESNGTMVRPDMQRGAMSDNDMRMMHGAGRMMPNTDFPPTGAARMMPERGSESGMEKLMMLLGRR